jgi:hypothetical protein
MEKGNNYIQFRCTIKCGMIKIIIMIADIQITNNIPNNTLAEEILKII